MRILLAIIVLTLALAYTSTVSAADTTIRYKDQPPPSAISPSLSVGSGNDICVVVRSGAIGTGLFSGSFGTHIRDMNCERLKLARGLAQLGLKVSATSVLCQDPRIFIAMVSAGSPCPINGKIGDEAIKEYRKRGILDENNNLLVSPNVANRSINKPRRNDYGQPTE